VNVTAIAVATGDIVLCHVGCHNDYDENLFRKIRIIISSVPSRELSIITTGHGINGVGGFDGLRNSRSFVERAFMVPVISGTAVCLSPDLHFFLFPAYWCRITIYNRKEGFLRFGFDYFHDFDPIIRRM
jgi:hypothetical protein